MEAGGVGVVTMKALLRLWLVGWLLVPGGAVWAQSQAFTRQPEDITVPSGCRVVFDARLADSSQYTTFQWYLGGEAIAGATRTRYIFHPKDITAEPATYFAVVTGDFGSITSRIASISVGPPVDCLKQAPPKLRIGRKPVELMVKAERFMPLVMWNQFIPLIQPAIGVTDFETVRTFGFPNNPWVARDRFTWEQAQTAEWPSSYLFKDCLGITSMVMGYYSSNAPVWWSRFSLGYGFSNGVYQSRCVLISPRFVMSNGNHANIPKYIGPQQIRYEFIDTNGIVPIDSPYTNAVFQHGTNFYRSWFFPTNAYHYHRYIGTNNDVHFRTCIAILDYGTYIDPTTNRLNIQYDWPLTNVDPKYQFCLGLLDADLPPSVVPCQLMPPDFYRYMESEEKKYLLPRITTDQRNWTHFYIPPFLAGKLHYQLGADWPGHPGGNSGSPSFYLLDGKCIRSSWEMDEGEIELLKAAMKHLWTTVAGLPEETCQMPTFVDLSRFDKLQ